MMAAHSNSAVSVRVASQNTMLHWNPASDGPLPASLRGGGIMLGNFDGFHRGHRAVARLAASYIDGAAPLIVMCTNPHPRTYFSTDRRFRITPGTPPTRLLESLGIHVIYAPVFDAAFATQSSEQFVARALVEDLGVQTVICGSDFHFGHRRAGNVDSLRALGDRYGLAVRVLDDIVDGAGARISSTAVRSAIRTGDLALAADLLGRDWELPVSNSAQGWSIAPDVILPPDGLHMVHCFDRAGYLLGAGRLEIEDDALAAAQLHDLTAGVTWTSLFGRIAP
ncbi:adenylyltransferase/cytidyltransferase family protein [Devosia sp. A369]